jgi:hypothetical protein
MLTGPELDEGDIDRMLAQALGDGRLYWPKAATNPPAPTKVLERIRFHGLGVVIADCVDITMAPHAFQKEISALARDQAVLDLTAHSVLSAVAAASSDAGIKLIFLKGVAMGYSVYVHPSHRQRGDIDVLVNKDDLDATRELLLGLGFTRVLNPAGPFGTMNTQEVWQIITFGGLVQSLDLHWEIFNAPALASILPVDRAISRAVPLPGLSSSALALHPADRMIHACCNQKAHAHAGFHYEGSRLFASFHLGWLRDVALLADEFSLADWQDLVATARQGEVAGICLAYLDHAQSLLGARIPEFVLKDLADVKQPELPALYFESTRSWERFYLDLRALSGPFSWLRLLLTRAFPSRDKLARRYPDMPDCPAWRLNLLRFWDILRNER